MRGSGGILLIGVAVIIIAASVSGRLDALWDALRGATGSSDDDSGGGDTSSDDPPTKFPDNTSSENLTCGQDDWLVQITGTGKWRCFNEGIISSPLSNGECIGNIPDHGVTNDGKEVCVVASRGRMPDTEKPAAAGYGKGYNLVHLPNGFTGLRYAPNVR